jgi:hypothetical protein
MKTNTLLIGLLLGLTFFSACKGSREVKSSKEKVSAKFLIEQLEDRRNSYHWFTGRSKMDFDNGSMKQSFTANIRMRKDSIIWVSLTGFLGIEGARILITPDSFKVIDHLNKKVYNKPIQYIQQFVPIDVGIEELQDVLVGDLTIPRTNKFDAETEPDNFVLRMDEGLMSYTYWMKPTDYTVSQFRLKNPINNQQMLVKFEDYKDINTKQFSYKRNFDIQDATQRILLNSSFTKVNFNEPADFPFKIPSKYTFVD